MTNADYQALLYSRDRLSLLQKGLTAVLNAMQGVLAVQDDLASGGMMSIKSAEHAKQLEQIDKDCWERIRVELLDVYKSFKKRASIPGTEINGNDVKDKSAAECLLGLTERVDDVKKGLDTRLKVTAKREENMIKEVRLLQEQLYDERQQSVELKWKAQEATENAGKYTVPVLQQQLKEKQEEISQLKRNSTVQLWDKEKAKLIEGYKTREEKLTKELADTRKRFEDMKEKLTEKLRETEEKLKMQKMKDALDKKIINRNVSKSMESINSSSSERNRRDNVAGGRLHLILFLFSFYFQIKDHYDQFRRYDTSGDLLLDFTEVVRAIQSTVGNFYSPAQVKEAMNEIDSDKNDTVDFYEYLTIALMVTNKRGRSEVFRSGIVKHGGQSVMTNIFFIALIQRFEKECYLFEIMTIMIKRRYNSSGY
nr:uncharacterized protein LOC129278664 [Lytechinus pictus]